MYKCCYSRVGTDIEEALRSKSFRDRIAAKLASDPHVEVNPSRAVAAAGASTRGAHSTFDERTGFKHLSCGSLSSG